MNRIIDNAAGPRSAQARAGSAVGCSVAAKELSTLTARYALAGCELCTEIALNGSQRIYAICSGWTKPLADLEAAQALLTQIGGAHA